MCVCVLMCLYVQKNFCNTKEKIQKSWGQIQNQIIATETTKTQLSGLFSESRPKGSPCWISRLEWGLKSFFPLLLLAGDRWHHGPGLLSGCQQLPSCPPVPLPWPTGRRRGEGVTSRQARCTSFMMQPALIRTCCFRSRQLSSSVASRIFPSAEHTRVSLAHPGWGALKPKTPAYPRWG